ncbi:MAG: CRISPR-associated endonuclease Cas2 [Succinivibrionaceae bacterium]
MRLILMFDLPMETAKEKRIYRQFHKQLLKEGFYMFQFSIYVKLAINRTVSQQIRARIKKIKPEEGKVSILEITERQFSEIEFISGSNNTNILNTTDRVTIFED